MKKLLLLIPIIFLLTGCLDYTEIDDLIIITGILLDYKDNKYEIISETLDNEKETKIKIYKTTCYDIDTCLLQISKQSNKDIFLSHLKSLILTDRTINKNIDFYDYFLRNSKSKMNFYTYYVQDEYKDNIFNENNKTPSSLYLKELSEFNNNIYSSSTTLQFIDMIQKQIEDGIDNIYPSISLKDNNLFLDSLVIFDKDNNKIKLNNNEGIFYNILSNNMIKSSIIVPCNNNIFTLDLNYLKTKYNYNNNLNININLNGKISNYNCEFDLAKKGTIKKLETLANNYIENESNKLLQLSKDNNIDFLGLKRYIYKHNKLNIELNNIKTNTTSNLKIISIGESR